MYWSKRTEEWLPCGEVLRGNITVGPSATAVRVKIDDVTLNMREFSRLLSICEGWCFRICFYDESTVETRPKIIPYLIGEDEIDFDPETKFSLDKPRWKKLRR